MIFNNPPRLPSTSGVNKFLQIDLYGWMKNVVTGLLKLSFNDNFDSFTISNLVIPAMSEVQFSNQLHTIPSGRLITKQIGNGLVTDGEWTLDLLKLFNNGAVDVTITVIFLR